MSDNIYPFPAGRLAATCSNRTDALLPILESLRYHFALTQPIKILGGLEAIRINDDLALRIELFLYHKNDLVAQVRRRDDYLFVARFPLIADETPNKPTRWVRGWEPALFEDGWRSAAPDPASYAPLGYLRKRRRRASGGPVTSISSPATSTSTSTQTQQALKRKNAFE